MRVVGGLGKLLVATLVAGVLVAGLLLPYAVGVGLASNKVTDAIAETPLTDMDQPFPERTTITDSRGAPIAYVYEQNRVPVPLSKISPLLVQAIVSTEDRRYYIHPGVDWRGTIRALLKNSSGTTGQQGGSTLTQQFVKNYRFLVEARTDQEKAAAIAATPLRKLQEAKIALTLELPGHLSKDDIMERYLNLVAFAPSVYGAQAAAQYFFGIDADKLNLQQAALLAGMVNNPNKYNPFDPDHYQDAVDRKNLVLNLMAQNGAATGVTQAQATAAKKKSLGLNRTPTPNGCLSADNHATYGYFCQYVLDYLENQGMSSDDIARGGYTIRTTLDPAAMKNAKAAVDGNANPSVAANKRVADVLAVVQPNAGIRKVLALAANRPYGLDKAKGETVQRLVTTFAPLGAGSTFKIFTAAEALKEGLGTQSILDSPASYTSPNAPAHAFNNSGTFPSQMTMQQALATSPNTAFVSLEDQIGLQKVVQMAVAMGMKGYSLDAGQVDRSFTGSGRSYAQEVVAQNIVSFTLGVSPVSPLELANVGATLASDGLWCPPTPVDTVFDRDGNPVQQKQQACAQAVDPELARTLSHAMQDDLTADNGTAHAAAVAAKWTRVAASKTGTTEDYKSSAFLGFTPFYSGASVVWDYLDRPQSICINSQTRQLSGSCSTPQAMGQTPDRSTTGMSGGSVPAATWLSAMTPLHAGLVDDQFGPEAGRYKTGSDNAQVPNVIGYDLDTARSQLSAKGFKAVVVVSAAPSGAAANVVIDQSPKINALPGSNVTITISAGTSG
ncbi:penicillin-binding protein [Nakamurella endophytica]|uniref:Penicillin-binding protein n=1 Tax=Nakamurella endophytica TaxID=1748367 RepID=A0A917T035_9ACTN|nr:penicillin-binding protein [Nakamurella endophytica]GGM05498.1 penicillin-binding protein [Nakamurella endophytica]